MKDPYLVLRRALEESPHLKPYLTKIAKRYYRRGVLTGRHKLASGDAHFLDLCHLFGVHAVNRNTLGHVTVFYDRFFEGTHVQGWIAALHRVLDQPMSTAAEDAQAHEREVAMLLKTWQLTHPECSAIHTFLAEAPQNLSARLKQQTRAQILDEWDRVLAISRFLMENESPIGLADLSARFTGDSKALRFGSILKESAEWLAVSTGVPVPSSVSDRKDLLANHGLSLNPTAVKVTLFGPIVYETELGEMDWIYKLWTLGQSATLSRDNLMGVKCMRSVSSHSRVITCENETPFNGLLEKDNPDVCIYTEGFPNSSVLQVVKFLAGSEHSFLHWGDSDLNGLRIAGILKEWAPFELYRCNLHELKMNQHKLRPMNPDQRARTESFLAKHPQFPFSRELQYSLSHGWLEQEAWGI